MRLWLGMLLNLGLVSAALAQGTSIETDGSVGEAVTIGDGGTGIYTIPETLGARSGVNLFHSFDTFDLGAGDTADFTATQATERVISRVTGKASQIDGTLRSSILGADFYFLNPRGVMFGQGASIEVDGSFHVSTANELAMEALDGSEVLAFSGDAKLATAVPSAFGFFGAPPAEISVVGATLQQDAGEGLSLVGGPIRISGAAAEAKLLVEGGRLEIVSLGAPGEVAISEQANGVVLAPDEAVESGSIELVNAQLGLVGAGGITLQAGRIELVDPTPEGSGFDGSFYDYGPAEIESRPDASPQAPGGDIVLRARELRLDGARVVALSTVDNGTEKGGSVRIEAESVTLVGASAVEAVVSGSSDTLGGDVEITATPAASGTTALSLTGESLVNTDSHRGISGQVRIQGFDEVTLDGRSQIRSDADGHTSPGAWNGDVALTDIGALRLSERAEISSGAFDGANQDPASTPGVAPGNVTIAADSIELRSGGSIESISVSAGDGGNVDITTRTLLAEGAFVDPDEPTLAQPSGVSSTIGYAVSTFPPDPPTSGGDIVIRAEQIQLLNGGRIAAETIAAGQGGNVELIVSGPIIVSGFNQELAEALDEIGLGDVGHPGGSVALQIVREEDFAHSAIATSSLVPVDADSPESLPFGNGSNAGNIIVNAGSLTLADGGLVAAFSQARAPTNEFDDPGDAGNISFDVAGTLEIETGSSITAEADFTGGGNLTLVADILHVHDSLVETSVKSGTGGGGNMDVSANLVALNSAEIRANADEGAGGNITIDAGNFLATPDSVVDASANTGIDGVVAITSPDVNVEAGLTQIQVQFSSASNLLRPSCAARAGEERAGSFVVAKRRGVPGSPEDLLLAFDAVGGATGVAAVSAPAVQAQAAGAGAKAATVASLAAANAFRGGDLDQAEAHYAEAAKLIAETGGDAKQQGIALRGLAQTQQAAGRYAASLETLRGAVTLAEQSGDSQGLASALGGLGNAYVALGRGAEAAPLLERGIAIATESGDTVLAAGLWNNLGNHHAMQASWADAGAAYEQAARLAAASGNTLAEAKTLANAAHAALDADQPDRARALLARAETRIDALPTSAERAGLRIHAAHVWANLADAAPAHRREALLAAHRLLTAALEESQALGAERTRSYALGNLGALYQSERHAEEALLLTRQAIRSAEAADAPESLYRWYWQEAQLLRTQQEVPAALASYRRSIEVLEETREEAQGRYGAAAAYFRSAVAPVYVEMVDLLLERADKMPVAGAVMLAEARSTMEQLKAAELRDYFRDECVAELAAKTTTLEDVAGSAAVIYPIVLPQRLELLVTLPSGLRRYTTDVPAQELSDAVGRFRRALQDPGSDAYRALGATLYDWLVRPYAADLEKAKVSTLVFVPDGPLRTVPMAALFDGERYLADRFALAVTPSLALVDPHPLDRAGMQVLLGGVSESVAGFPALASVPAELEAVSKRTGGEVLLDDDFGLRQVETAIRETQPTVVHIASHAVFTGDPETSFVLLHDDKLTMERLSGVVGMTKYRERPLELLVLSACETAAGDERAGLGLAGVAIRAGARSAVGSLWPISDEGAYRLIDAFYEALADPSVSKAEALKVAQAKLRSDPRFAHPYFWSPFLIINNWL